jgi:cyclase
MSYRVFLMFGFAAMLAAGLLVSRSDAQPDSFKEIAKGVWFRQGDVEKKGHCNNVVIELPESLLVVDANFPSGAEALVKDIKKVSSKPVKWVFDTHHHGDHAYGNAFWTGLGATTLAHENVVKEMDRYEPKRWKETNRKDVRDLKRDTAEAPKKTFSQSPYVIEEGGRRVEFHHFGWAHTRGDGFVYLPKEKILCTGDAVTNGPYNFMADGNVANWPKVIAAAQKLDVVHVLPGHGPAGGKDVLEGERQFLLELYKVAAKGRQAKDPLFAKANLSEGVKKWVGPGLAGQLQTAYQEIEAKQPAGDLAH